MLTRLVLASALVAGTAAAQETPVWELGAIGGYGYAPGLTAKAPAGSVDTGFNSGGVVGVFGGNDMYEHWSGEARYLYRYSDTRLSSSSAHVDFGAHTQIANADFLAHFKPRAARIRPFIAFGGGVKVLQGTGTESASQPLGRYAALTHTRETLPTADIGVGVKFNMWKLLRLRLEVRDYISPPPSKVIAPVPGGSINGWVHDIQGLALVSYKW